MLKRYNLSTRKWKEQNQNMDFQMGSTRMQSDLLRIHVIDEESGRADCIGGVVRQRNFGVKHTLRGWRYFHGLVMTNAQAHSPPEMY
jgi:hypothetical protein